MAIHDSYELTSLLQEGATIVVHRGRHRESGAPVVLKCLRPEAVSPQAIARMRSERDILAKLAMPGIPRVRAYLEDGLDVALVLDDIGGETLEAFAARRAGDLPALLGVAARIAEILARVHARGVIHKDMNPRNLIVGQGGKEVQIIDFNISTILLRDLDASADLDRIEGTLAFISPEQTGRIASALDERADLYSLGASLYALWTGAPPFSADDPGELVHAHLARVPAPPVALAPDLPAPLSDITLALLAKAPEDRYQSAAGLAADLAECLRQLTDHGRIDPFPLGRRDASRRFRIPDRLYGREAEVATLTAALGRVRSSGRPEIVIVAGAPGAGKSAVIGQIAPLLAPPEERFGAGKFAELERGTPYSALIQALAPIVRGLLAEPEARLAAWRREIASALGGLGALLADVIPEIGVLLGEIARPPEVGPAEAKQRFMHLIRRFVRLFAERGRALVLCLDDLQWADPATLELLPILLEGRDDQGIRLLLVGVHRDEAVLGEHPLIAALDAVAATRVPITRLSIGPLGVDDIGALVADTIGRSREEAAELAALVHKKTQGNALFAGELLKTLHRGGLLAFDPEGGRFTWDLARIEAVPFTDNVVAMVTSRARTLGAETQRVLGIAGCIGDRFDLGLLAAVSGRGPDETEKALGEALSEELLLRVGDGYRFLHDRVREAIVAAVSPADRARIHAEIARAMIRDPEIGERDDRIFELAHHLNAAGDSLTAEDERITAARVNLRAASRAWASAAYEAALDLCEAGIRHLPEGAFQDHYDLAFALHLNRARSGITACRYAEVGRQLAYLRSRARGKMDRAEVFAHLAEVSFYMNAIDEGIDASIEGLAILGVEVPRAPSVARVMLELMAVRRALAGRAPEEILDLPAMTDPTQLVASAILVIGSGCAINTYPNLQTWMMLRLARIALLHGNAPESASGYMFYGLAMGMVTGDPSLAERFGRLSLKLPELYPNKYAAAMAKFAYAATIFAWANPMRGLLPIMREIIRDGVEGGNTAYVCWTRSTLARAMIQIGAPLEEAQSLAEEGRAFAIRIQERTSPTTFARVVAVCRSLRGLTEDPARLEAPGYDEAEIERVMGAARFQIPIHLQLHDRALHLFVLRRDEEALEILDRVRPDVDRVLQGLFDHADHHFLYGVLAADRAARRGPIARRRDLLAIRATSLRRLRKWAESAPANFHHRARLVAASIAAAEGDDHAAISAFEDAIRSAREGGMTRDEAIALERAGLFYRSRGLADVARLYLVRASAVYARWGAAAKVALLDAEEPGLRHSSVPPARSSVPPARIDGKDRESTTTSTSLDTRVLDAPSLFKASQAISSEITLERLLARLMTILVENAGAQRGALVLGAQGALSVRAEVSAEEGVIVHATPVPLEDSVAVCQAIVQYVVRTQHRVLLRDASSDGDFVRDLYIERARPKSLLCLPLVLKGEARGALYLENNLVAGAFSEARVAFLAALCAQLAISVDHAYLYADLEEQVRARTRDLEETQARLVALEKEATESQMAGGFAHEMRNALAGARMLLAHVLPRGDGAASLPADSAEALLALYERLRDRLGPEALEGTRDLFERINDNEERLDGVLRKIEAALGRALGVTQLVLHYGKLGAEQPGVTTYAPRAIVDDILGKIEADLAARGVKVEVSVDPAAILSGNPDHAYSIFENLILNARDAIADKAGDGPRRIRVALGDVTADRATITVEDTGVGIAPEHRARLFEPFFSTKPHTGTGLGLGMVRKLVVLYGGSIEIDSELGRGARFIVTLPRPPIAAAAREGGRGEGGILA